MQVTRSTLKQHTHPLPRGACMCSMCIICVCVWICMCLNIRISYRAAYTPPEIRNPGRSAASPTPVSTFTYASHRHAPRWPALSRTADTAPPSAQWLRQSGAGSARSPLLVNCRQSDAHRATSSKPPCQRRVSSRVRVGNSAWLGMRVLEEAHDEAGGQTQSHARPAQ